MNVRIGSLCSGTGALDAAAEQVTGGRTVWHAENMSAAVRLLRHRYPGVVNHNDLKALKWAHDHVDVLTGGYPCQPFSGAGKRLGTNDPRHLFPWIAQGVAIMRPTLLLLENVRGHLTLGFDIVLAELDRIGYDVRWTLLSASAVGAPHGRSRLWIAARDRDRGGWPAPAGEPTALLNEQAWVEPSPGLFGYHDAPQVGTDGVMVQGQRWDRDVVQQDLPMVLLKTPQHPDKRKAGGHGPTLAGRVGTASHAEALRRGQLEACVTVLLPTPRATDGTKGGPNQRGSSGDLMLPSAVMHLLPRPAVNDMGAGKTVEAWDAWTAAQKARHANGNGHGPSLHIEAARMHIDRWGKYAAAVARWEALTRPAPASTEAGRNGPRLSPALPEWMMGLPEGWVTATPGLSRNEQLTLLGNGVCTQQAVAAYTLLGVTPECAMMGKQSEPRTTSYRGPGPHPPMREVV